RDETVRVFQAAVPRPGGAHRHAAQHDAVPVDAIVAADGLNSLENVGLACPTVTVLDAAERMQLDEILLWRVLAFGVTLIEAVQEAQLAHADWPGTAMQDDIEADGLLRIILRRDDHTVGLYRAVHRRDERARDLSL